MMLILMSAFYIYIYIFFKSPVALLHSDRLASDHRNDGDFHVYAHFWRKGPHDP